MENAANYIEVWSACLRTIQEVLSPSEYSTWFVPIKPISLEKSCLTLEVPSDFVRSYIESNYLGVLKASLTKHLGSDARLKYQLRPVKNGQTMVVLGQDTSNIVSSNKPLGAAVNPAAAQNGANPFYNPTFHKLSIDPRLSPQYRFSNMVVGDCNKMGITAGENIALNPGRTPFNPLFIFGGSGLGKTHLAQAVGNCIKEKHPELVVLYMTGNEFKTQYMDAANQRNNLTSFLAYYMKIDVLIVDDIQDLQGAQASQNAFFNVFNHLHNNGKQLIFTSDRAPVQLQNFEERLLSRFKWGLSVELTRPDFETRLNALKAKRESEGVDMSDEVLEVLASHVRFNFRELEGAFISLVAHATLAQQNCTVELANKVIAHLISDDSQDLTIAKVLKAVSDYFGISREDICSNSRKRQIVQARQIAMYLSRRNISGISLSLVGREIGDKDHATVLHSCNAVEDQRATDKVFAQYISDIEKLLGV